MAVTSGLPMASQPVWAGEITMDLAIAPKSFVQAGHCLEVTSFKPELWRQLLAMEANIHKLHRHSTWNSDSTRSTQLQPVCDVASGAEESSIRLLHACTPLSITNSD